MTTTCNTCAAPEHAPRIRRVDGTIVEQCVDRCHDRFVRGMDNQSEFLRLAIRKFNAASVRRAGALVTR